MRETPGARAAYADYLALGPDRSLAKLLDLYRSRTESAPTRHLTTLKQWSVAFGWQARLQAIADQAAQDAEAAESAHRRAIMETGYALDYERVSVLKRAVDRLLKDILPESGDDSLWGHIPNRYGGYERFNGGLIKELRGLLDDVAAETGGRVQKTELTGKDGGPVVIERVVFGDQD